MLGESKEVEEHLADLLGNELITEKVQRLLPVFNNKLEKMTGRYPFNF